jgi:hypothetical protein
MLGHRMGRLWKFKKDEVDAWVKAGGAAASLRTKSPGAILNVRRVSATDDRQEAQGV